MFLQSAFRECARWHGEKLRFVARQPHQGLWRVNTSPKTSSIGEADFVNAYRAMNGDADDLRRKSVGRSRHTPQARC
jgi:hypothetical protein